MLSAAARRFRAPRHPGRSEVVSLIAKVSPAQSDLKLVALAIGLALVPAAVRGQTTDERDALSEAARRRPPSSGFGWRGCPGPGSLPPEAATRSWAASATGTRGCPT